MFYCPTAMLIFSSIAKMITLSSIIFLSALTPYKVLNRKFICDSDNQPRDSSLRKQPTSLPLPLHNLSNGGCSSGSTSDYGSRGPRFDSLWELGFFLFSILSEVLPISGPSWRCITSYIKCSAVQLEAKQA